MIVKRFYNLLQYRQDSWKIYSGICTRLTTILPPAPELYRIYCSTIFITDTNSENLIVTDKFATNMQKSII